MVRRDVAACRKNWLCRLAALTLVIAAWAAPTVAVPPPAAVPAAVSELTATLPPGGTVRALAADPATPGRVLLGTMTGVVFVSPDRGDTWRFLSRIAPHDDWVVAALVADPGQAGRWYAGLWSWDRPGAGGVFTSADGGRTWTPLLEGHAVRALALAASDRRELVAGTLDGVYRTRDAGAHWSLISPKGDRELQNIESVAIDPVHPGDIYVGTWHLPWKTVNGGHDWWQMRQGVIDDSDVFSIAVDRTHPDTVYLSACSGIYRSDNRGNQFRKIQGIPYSARRTPALVQDPDHPQTIYAGTTQGLWVTRNAGVTWARITRPRLSINTVLLLPARGAQPERILLGINFGGVYASDNRGASFHPLNRGFASRQVSAIAASPAGRYLAVTGDEAWGGIFLRSDPPAAPAVAGVWRQVPSPLAGHDVYGLHWSPAGLLAATGQGVYRRPPATKPRWLRPRTAPRDRVYALAGPAAASPTVFAATRSGLYRSLDGGVRWRSLRAAPAPLYRVLALPPDAAGHRWLFIAGDGYVLRSDDEGDHFIAGRLAVDGVIHQLAAAPGAGGAQLILAATSRGLYRSADFGRTWTLCGHGLPATDIRAVHVQPDGLFALTSTVGAVYRSRDGGRHWSPFPLEPAQETLARESDGRLGAWTAPAAMAARLARP